MRLVVDRAEVADRCIARLAVVEALDPPSPRKDNTSTSGFLRKTDPEAAADLGAPPLRIFTAITLPRLAPGLLSAGLLSLSISTDVYVVSSITAGSVVTFPLRIAGAFQREISPQIHVLSTLVLLISLVALVLSCRDTDEGRNA